MMRLHDGGRKLVGATKCPKLLSPTTTPPSTPPPPPSPFLPEELIVEILVRLPVRSLLQLKSVCKSWKTIISGSQFAKYHIQRSTTDPTLTHPRLAYSNDHKDIWRIGFFSIRSLLENPSAPTKVVCLRMACNTGIVGSCNGLLCVHDPFRVRLWNPCTRLASEWLEVENPEKQYLVYSGFGYDHVHDKYKLIVHVRVLGTRVTKLYTFGSSSWTTIDFPDLLCCWPGTFLSGTLNWIAIVPRTKFDQLTILSFDLGKETFGRMSLPEMNDDNLSMPELGVLRNCLCACFEDNKSSQYWDVWLMKEYGVEQSWTKLTTIPHDIPARLRVRWIHSFKPFYISENDVVVGRSAQSTKLVLHNSNDCRLDYPCIDSSSDGLLDCPMIKGTSQRILHIYHESLVSPSHCGLQICLSGLTVD